MSRILKIDQFVEAFPSKYGLSSDGSYYDVLEDFYAEALLDYKNIGKSEGIDYLKPVWNKIKIIKGDILISSKSGVYVQPKGYDSLIEIRPFSLKTEGDSFFNRFHENKLSKIGKELTPKKIMDSKTKNKIISTRGI